METAIRMMWLAVGAVALGASTTPAIAQSLLPRGHVVFPDAARVTVEIVDTEAGRQRGLMFRTTLAPNEGMIFVFPRAGFYPFWMKNTLIPLDMIWLDARARIVSIASSVPLCKADPCPSIPPDGDALYVVELVAGSAARHGLKVGDVLTLEGITRIGK